MILQGIGFVVFTFPHFVIGKYHPPDPSVPSFLCTNLNQSSTVQSSMNTTTASEGCNEGFIAEWYCLTVMLVGQFIAGTGCVSLFAFSPASFHEFASHKNLPTFFGLWQASIFLTPIAAFGMSEPLLELYVDITQVLLVILFDCQLVLHQALSESKRTLGGESILMTPRLI